MINDKRLDYISGNDVFDFYIYKPTFGKWLYKNYEHMRIQRWVRFLLEYVSKQRYVVYYIAEKDTILGYCFLAPGGRRLKCSNEKDIVLGPYYILPEFRGNGYSVELIRAVVERLHLDYAYAYDYIAKDNIPSKKATEACGFLKCAELNIRGVLRKLVICDDGEYIVYRKKRNIAPISSKGEA